MFLDYFHRILQQKEKDRGRLKSFFFSEGQKKSRMSFTLGLILHTLIPLLHLVEFPLVLCRQHCLYFYDVWFWV